MDLIITILPVVTKDLPISPRFTPYNFYRDASSALLQLVNQWLNFICSRVSYDIFLSIMEAAKPVFSVCTHDGGCAY